MNSINYVFWIVLNIMFKLKITISNLRFLKMNLTIDAFFNVFLGIMGIYCKINVLNAIQIAYYGKNYFFNKNKLKNNI